MLRYSLHLLILLLLAAFPAQSQNAKADILRINAAYSKFTDMSMNITYDVYLNAASTVPYQTEVGSYKQHGNLRYSRLKEIESLQNSKYLIVADNDQKRIVVGNPVKFNPGKITLLNLDTALSTCSTVSYVEGAAGLGGYRMAFKPNIVSQFDVIELYFNKKTYIVEKLVFFYRQEINLVPEEGAKAEQPKLEITFSSFDFRKINEAEFFSEKKFIDVSDKKYTASSAYTGYKIVDQKFLK